MRQAAAKQYRATKDEFHRRRRNPVGENMERARAATSRGGEKTRSGGMLLPKPSALGALRLCTGLGVMQFGIARS